MSKLTILKEIFEYIKVKKKWVLAPILMFLLFIGVLILLTEGSVLSPFIYALF